MRERLVTACGALLALLVLYAAFFQSTSAPVTRPVTPETGRNGYAAVSRWLESAGYRVISFRERYDRLIEQEFEPAPAFPFSGNVLITTMPHSIPVRSREHEHLKAWIRSGNTLLILAALDDRPEWSPSGADARFLGDLQIMSGLRFVPHRTGSAPYAEPSTVPAGTAVELAPLEGHPLMEGVSALRGYSDSRSAIWVPIEPRPFGDGDRVLLGIATERTTGVHAAWQRVYGNGHIIVVASGTLLTNHVVADSDAGRFLMNLIRHHLEEDGAVIFDDMHQGLSARYDASAFFRDARFHRTLWFLLGAWLVYVLGSSNRFAPPMPASTAPTQRDFIEAVAGFMARRLDERDAARSLLDAWFDEVRRARGLASREPPWATLEAIPTLDAATLERLRQRYEALQSGANVDLVELQNLLRSAREAIG
ncbi:MAG: DUF4350 domain-containing protein [Gammaproteobacteria bacterium]|nr:hypothetical protein [Gammaproteobacteria bacterium]